jgi:DNA replication protein DnaC
MSNESGDPRKRHRETFSDERLTAALLDRLAHKAHILEFLGESYRFRQRMRQEAQQMDDP